MWRLLYSKQRLLASEREKLEEILNDFSFTCGAPLQDLEMEGKLADVYTRNISCREPVEKLYYVAKYAAICVYCAEPMMGNMDAVQHYLPQCDVCKNKPPISNTDTSLLCFVILRSFLC